MVKNQTSLPFTAEEDRDGAMYVWFIFRRSGFDYPYTTAADFPKSPCFTRVEDPQGANIAWWKGFVALSQGKGPKVLTATGEASLKSMEKRYGKVSWYRFAGPPPAKNPLPTAKAPLSALKEADNALLGLGGAASFPPQVKDDAERDQLRLKWEKTVANLELLRRKYPDDPQVLRLVGVGFRMGYNLGMPGAWERAEAYLLQTEQLAPDAPEAYISLGVLYADTDPDYAVQAEHQFRTALTHARKEQLPRIWWGLAVALNYQGKVREAVKTIDRLIALRPDDVAARKLRETFLADKGN
jgi:tetratricopeptide (TPR) repeat protein